MSIISWFTTVGAVLPRGAPGHPVNMVDRMTSLQLVLTALLFLALGIASSVDAVHNIADRASQDAEEDSVEYPRPVDSLTTTLDEEDEIGKTVNDIPGLTEDMVSKALSEARREVLDEDKKVERDPGRKTRGHTHQSMHYKNRYNPALEPTRKRALIMERTMKKVADSLGMKTAREKRSLYGVTSVHMSRLSCFAKPPLLCNAHAPFRTADGKCNNLRRPYSGSANSAHTRLTGVGSNYADGISAPRVSVTGNQLPNARVTSSTLFIDVNTPSTRLSHMTMKWGQFTDHDTTLGAQPDIMCRERCEERAGECVNILISQEDRHFPSVNVFCIPLLRDAPAVPANCGQMRPREQMNTRTAFIDSSQVYGVSVEIQRSLRELNPDVGRLIERPHPAGPGWKGLLPVMTNGTCRSPNPFLFPCFRSGDVRTNENHGLAVIHHMFIREHNRIANTLRQLNPHWTGERIFQTTRKIVGAMNQHLIYNEYLAAILDPKTRENFGLKLKTTGFFDGYNENINPAVINSFAAAAFRFGHSQIRNTMSRVGKNMQRFMDIDTTEFHDPSHLYDLHNGGIDAIIRGLVYDKAQQVDRFFSRAIQDNLRRDEQDISDLLAINIQRARERGIPGYNAFRKACGLRPLTSLEDVKATLPAHSVARIGLLYEHLDDIDLFVGGILERELPGGAVGPTFACIIAQQFRSLRYGDRFWYERNDPIVGFSLPQLNELRKVSLARIICDNSDHIEMLPRWVFSLRSQQVPCHSLPAMDLRYWKDAFHYGV